MIKLELKGEYHSRAHALVLPNVTVYKPIGNDVIIHAGNLQVRVKISRLIKKH